MKIVSIKAENAEGGQLLTLGVYLPGIEELEDGDLPRILNQLRELTGASEPVSRDAASFRVPSATTTPPPKTGAPAAAPAQTADEGNAPTRRRRTASAAPAETAPTEPSADAGSATGDQAAPTRRRRTASADAGNASTTAAPSGGGAKISNVDLAKAMARLGEAVGIEEAKDFLLTSQEVERVAEIPDEKRAAFLAAIKEITG